MLKQKVGNTQKNQSLKHRKTRFLQLGNMLFEISEIASTEIENKFLAGLALGPNYKFSIWNQGLER